MKTAIISDIHGNFEAFNEVLADIDQMSITDIVCLGDCIGYGPEPEEVVAEIRRREIPTIIGNHELALIDRRHLNWFNPQARASVEKTIAMLSNTSIQLLKDLPMSVIAAECRCVHGYPPDDARAYLFQKKPYQLIKTFKSMAEQICFVGHTHNLELIDFDGRQVERNPLGRGVTALASDRQYIINVGSVGQPRDGDNHAKYIIFDSDNHRIDVRFVAYDIGATVDKIKSAGLPIGHANRLW